MSIQVKRRREAASFLSTFVGAAGELIVDTTNNRVQVHDGTTPGGWPAAKLGEVLTNTRHAIADAPYTVLASDRMIAFTALTASRSVTLCAASVYPAGTILWIVDESGACSAANTIIVNRAGTDTIDGAVNFVLDAAYGALALESDGVGKWSVLSPSPNVSHALLGVGTAPDAGNPLSVNANTALFNAKPTGSGGSGDFRFVVNKDSAANTASYLFQDGFSGRAEVGLCGDDNVHVKVSPDGSSWKTGLLIDAATGALTPGNARTPISDADYSALASDRLIAYFALSAARTVTLPAASAFPAGVPLTVVDESGACSPTDTIAIARSGADTINGEVIAVIAAPYGSLVLECNGVGAWTIVAQAQTGKSYNRVINGAFAINQRGYTSGSAFSAGVFAHDRWKAGASGCAYTFTQADPDTQITITSGSLQQVIEGVNIEGGVYTLSWSGSAQGRINGGAYAASPLTGWLLPAGAGVTIEFEGGALGQVQFDVGASAKAFTRRPIGEELLLCMRYFQLAPTWFGAYWETNDAVVTCSGPLLAPMRADPTVTLVYGTNGLVQPGVTFVTITDIRTNAIGEIGGYLDFDVPAGTAGVPAMITNTANIACSAEL